MPTRTEKYVIKTAPKIKAEYFQNSFFDER
jgi:hypothetical protein